MKTICAVIVMCLAQLGVGSAQTVSLNGAGWSFHTAFESKAHPVTIPDCWPTHEKYRNYVGVAMYERDFASPQHTGDDIVRLRFDGVYYKTHVWLNGKLIGEHEGGYTPFTFDITSNLRAVNHLIVEVDSSWSLESIPGLATAGPSHLRGSKTPPQAPPPKGSAMNARAFAWWSSYGGINRDVSLIVTGPVYIENVKIESIPDIAAQTAQVSAHIFLHNASHALRTVSPIGEVAGLKVKLPSVKVAPGTTKAVEWTGKVARVHLWNLDGPYLYPVDLHIAGDSFTTRIGIREVRVQGTELLLNGKPVHLFGANRVSEDPKYGLIEPQSVIERDMGDMLAANLRMMRIAHYPQAPALLDYADAHGMLIIAEAGNWGMGAWQMADPGIRALWKAEMKEMAERDWNHPSIIAWSLGNEYESVTQEGIAWTRDMRAYTLSLDATRLITFASCFTSDDRIQTGKDEGSQYSDFVSMNVYGNYGVHLDRAHALWPDKPIFVTEFGKSGESSLHDPARIAEIKDAVAAMKSRPYVIGGSIWAYADYRSRFPGTPSDGLRKWGLVTFNRQHRDSWEAARKLFAPDHLPTGGPQK